jgi:hypothetical protein
VTVTYGSLIKLNMYVVVLIAYTLSLYDVSEAGNAEYVKLNVESTYQLEIPKSWKLHDENSKKALTINTDSKFSAANIKQIAGQSRILVAANKYEANSTVASARLSVRPAKTLSQNDLRQMTQNDIEEMSRGTEADLQNVSNAVGSDVKTKLISIKRKVINNKFCISTQLNNNYKGKKTMRNITDLYFLGDRYVELTVSYNVAESKTYKSITNKIRHSLIIN